jgi:putative DNA primase/helicase
VFIGTTNSVDGYFKDPTGSRRFWPVSCGSIDVEALTHDREQLWAEAVQCFEQNVPWWLEGPQQALAKAQQSTREESDPWEMAITEYVSGRTKVTTSGVLIEQLKIDLGDQGRLDEMRVTAILTKLGWWKKRVMEAGDRHWTWYCPTYQEDFNQVGHDVGQEIF